MSFRLAPRYRYFGLSGVLALEQGTTDTATNLEATQNKLTVVPYYWNPNTMAFEVGRQPSTGGGGAGSTAVDATLSSAGSTRVVGKVELSPTTPGSSNDYLWVRTLGSGGAGSTVVDVNSISSSTGHLGDVSVSSGTVTVANPTTSVSLSSQITVSVTGTTAVTVSNPTTSVSLSSQVTITVGNPTTSVSLSSQITASVSGTTAVNVANQPTVDLSSVGSTRVVGQVTVANPTTSVSMSSQLTVSVTGTTSVSVANPTTAVTVSSGVILGAGSSANTLGSVALVAGTTGNALGSVALLAGSSANLVGGVVINSGTTAITLGAAALLAGSSANTLGNVAQGPGGSSANSWISDGFSYSSANTSRTSISTTVDIAVVTANANTKGLIIANLSTSQIVALGMSTAAVTTGLANVSMYLQPNSQLMFGYGGGGFPNFTGNIRGINISSTTVSGGVAVTRFTNT